MEFELRPSSNPLLCWSRLSLYISAIWERLKCTKTIKEGAKAKLQWFLISLWTHVNLSSSKPWQLYLCDLIIKFRVTLESVHNSCNGFLSSSSVSHPMCAKARLICPWCRDLKRVYTMYYTIYYIILCIGMGRMQCHAAHMAY